MEIVVCGVPFGTDGEKKALQQVKEQGFTSVQIYTFWKDFEPEEGKFDWTHFDKQVQALKDAGLKYVPFILIGPKYAAPQWWLDHPDHKGLKCLEHGKTSPIDSIWNPALKGQVSRVLEAFAEHYLPWDVIESVQPGICGDYGEAIFPVLGNWPGDYHTHAGFWCGDDYAVASFCEWLKAKYGSVDAMNAAWRSHHESFNTVVPVLRHMATSRTTHLDMIDWYRESMTDFAGFWMSECRRCFPETPAYLCTGGMEEPEHGSLFAAQAKVSAVSDAGIRLTNEGNKFYDNFYLTSYTWSACRHYGASYGLEPVGPITKRGVRERVYGSIAYGNGQIFHYYSNVFDGNNDPMPSASALKDYLRYGGYREYIPKSISMFWPTDRSVLEGNMPMNVKDALLFVRHRHPVKPVSEFMINDGALADSPCLVMMNAESVRRPVLEAIADWVRNDGGILLTNGRVLDEELRPVEAFDSLFGILPDSEEAVGHTDYHIKPTESFDNTVAIGHFTNSVGLMGLADDVEMIAATKPSESYHSTQTKLASCMFRKQYPSGGQAIFYCGPTNFVPDPEAIMPDPGVFPALLDDVCRQSGVMRYDLKEGEVARTDIGGSMLILTEEEIIEEAM
ncbi:MAG: beta-galactosidase [Armatimonadota bacterium]